MGKGIFYVTLTLSALIGGFAAYVFNTNENLSQRDSNIIAMIMFICFIAFVASLIKILITRKKQTARARDKAEDP